MKKTKTKTKGKKRLAVQKNKPPIPFPVIRAIVETRYDFQDQRIRAQSRLKNNMEANKISPKILENLGVNEIFKKAETFENDLEKILSAELPRYPIYNEYLSMVRGIGPILASALIAYIECIEKFANISKLWTYFGFGFNRWCEKCKIPTYVMVKVKNKQGKTRLVKKLKPLEKCVQCNGKVIPIIQRRIEGYSSNWNDNCKVLGWKLGQSFIIQGKKSGYYKLYKIFRDEEKERHPKKVKLEVVKRGEKRKITQYNDLHLTNRAIRKVIKIFLAHLWTEWRTIENLEVTEPYAGKILGHSMIKPIRDKEKKQLSKSRILIPTRQTRMNRK